jgi:uncharacterized protein YdhG (YjbR/CyaY superfamily)
MKKTATRKRAAAGAHKGPPKSVDEYMECVPEAARAMLSKMRTAIRAAVPPEATEIVSYHMPAIKHGRVLVWYAAFANHCSLFPTASIIEAFRAELKGLVTTKGSIHFPLDKPLPTALIKKMVKARVAEAAG